MRFQADGSAGFTLYSPHRAAIHRVVARQHRRLLYRHRDCHPCNRNRESESVNRGRERKRERTLSRVKRKRLSVLWFEYGVQKRWGCKNAGGGRAAGVGHDVPQRDGACAVTVEDRAGGGTPWHSTFGWKEKVRSKNTFSYHPPSGGSGMSSSGAEAMTSREAPQPMVRVEKGAGVCVWANSQSVRRPARPKWADNLNRPLIFFGFLGAAVLRPLCALSRSNRP